MFKRVEVKSTTLSRAVYGCSQLFRLTVNYIDVHWALVNPPPELKDERPYTQARLRLVYVRCSAMRVSTWTLQCLGYCVRVTKLILHSLLRDSHMFDDRKRLSQIDIAGHRPHRSRLYHSSTCVRAGHFWLKRRETLHHLMRCYYCGSTPRGFEFQNRRPQVPELNLNGLRQMTRLTEFVHTTVRSLH